MASFPVWSVYALSALALFLSGSIPFGYIVGWINKVDLRQHGSGNIGATNAYRVLGKKWGIVAFAGDFLKGLLPLLVLKCLTRDWAHDNTYQGLFLVAGLAAILGHNFTPWLGFKGGKGIATSAGVLAAIIPVSFGVVLATWIVLMFATRTVSIASIAACAVLPVITAVYYVYYNSGGQWLLFAFALLTGILGVWRHRSNIARLRAGTEPRFGKPKA